MSFITFETPLDPADRDVEREPPPGRDLAEAIVANLEAAALHILEPVVQHEGYGWSFTVASSDRPVWCILQLSDEWLLITQGPRPSWIQRLRGAHATPAGEAEIDAR